MENKRENVQSASAIMVSRPLLAKVGLANDRTSLFWVLASALVMSSLCLLVGLGLALDRSPSSLVMGGYLVPGAGADAPLPSKNRGEFGVPTVHWNKPAVVITSIGLIIMCVRRIAVRFTVDR